MKEIRTQRIVLPKRQGKIAIEPVIPYGAKEVGVVIIGDRKGLLYLSDVLKRMAELDVDEMNYPKGERAHVHLHPGINLRDCSCDVEVCRAEAAITGALPPEFKKS